MATPLQRFSTVAHDTGATYGDMETFWANNNQVLSEILSGEADISFGTANAGKLLYIGSDGKVTLISGLTWDGDGFKYV